MSMIVNNCPRCGAGKTTFDIKSDHVVSKVDGWFRTYEMFCVCRHCGESTVFLAQDNGVDHSEYMDSHGGPSSINGSINEMVDVIRYISVRDILNVSPPEHIPEEIKAVFIEAAACRSIQCHNASAAMFRLCLDMTTKELLPKETEPDDKNLKHARKFLYARLEWLFDNNKLPHNLRDLAECVREDGNDGAHDGTLSEKDAEDVCDFTIVILETVFTGPKRLELAKERRNARRGGTE
jgi:Domain of unknown function (DUF4145)